MPRKKKNEPKPAAQPVFRPSHFAALKNFAISDKADKEPKICNEPEKNRVIREINRETSDDELFINAMDGVCRLGENTAKKCRLKPASGGTMQEKATVSELNTRLPHEEAVARSTFLKEIDRLQLDVRFTDSLPEEDELRPLAGNRLRQLRRGVVRIERQLDLHGLYRDEAVASLPGFLRAACNAGEQAVLVITGKGNNSAGEPVLQQSVAAWLREQGREYITEYAPAPREMGGNGAFVVFLRALDKRVRQSLYSKTDIFD